MQTEPQAKTGQGWVIFSGPTGYMSLATAAFYGVGFYIAAVLNGPLAFPVVIIVAGAMAFIIALLVGALTLRLRGVYFCIFTFAHCEFDLSPEIFKIHGVTPNKIKDFGTIMLMRFGYHEVGEINRS